MSTTNVKEFEVEQNQSKSDFSIEHILTRAGNKNNKNVQQNGSVAFSWLNCTRYCPPKLPRNQKREGPQKRQLGRHPRIPFSSQQLMVLENKFKQSPYLSSSEVTQLSKQLHLADIRVKIWFQNRRARERREKYDEFQQLKPQKTESNHNAESDTINNQLTPIITHQNLPNRTIIYNTSSQLNSSEIILCNIDDLSPEKNILHGKCTECLR